MGKPVEATDAIDVSTNLEAKETGIGIKPGTCG